VSGLIVGRDSSSSTCARSCSRLASRAGVVVSRMWTSSSTGIVHRVVEVNASAQIVEHSACLACTRHAPFSRAPHTLQLCTGSGSISKD
jgi:hypothetical protein